MPTNLEEVYKKPFLYCLHSTKIFISFAFRNTKKKYYGFIRKTFRQLKSGTRSWSEITREDWQLVESEKECIYCGTEGDLHKEHIVPRSVNINPGCVTCEKIQGIHNQVWACKQCNYSKGTMGLYEFYKKKYPSEKKKYPSEK